ncbi:hypothetical protein [Nocardiopsis alba]|uniref:hypothetical protein n=1 Tax=Nocardiopsis alba TaxID=53437 RepID=UPI0033A57EA1
MAWKNSRLLTELLRVRNGHETSAARPELPTARKALAELFADPDSEYLIRALLYRPEHLLGVVLPRLLGPQATENGKDTSEEQERRAAQASALHVWSVFTVCVEVLWEHVTGEEGKAHRHLEPLAARTRFLALSEPFRHRADDTEWEGWWRKEILKHLFGRSDTWVPLVRKVREARDIWRGHLNRHKSLPLFDHASPLAIEEEVRWLAFQDPEPPEGFFKPLLLRSPFSGGPLALTEPKEQGKGTQRKVSPPDTTAEDRAILIEAVEHYLLPRFAILKTWSAMWGLYRSRGHHGALLMYKILGVLLALTLTLLASALLVDRVPITWPLFSGVIFYACTVIGSACLGREWTAPLLVGIPIASAVGLIPAVAFHPDWWENATLNWPLPLTLAGFSIFLLLITIRKNYTGSPEKTLGVPLTLAGRASMVAIIGFAHSLMIATIGMVIVTATFGESGQRLREAWISPDGEFDLKAILLSTALWCLAAGMLTQNQWSGRSPTAQPPS